MPETLTSTRIDSKTTSFRWLIMGLAAFITIVNYLDRSAISYAIGPLKAEFGFNDEQFGLIASAFGIGYMLMTFVGGVLVDLLGAKKIWAVAAVGWSLMTGMIGMANSYWTFFLFRTSLGLAEGPNFPAIARVVTDWLPTGERARATAFGLSAVPLASAIGAPLISNLIVQFGWKVMFMILGSLGIIWTFFWLRLFTDYPENSRYVSAPELEHIRGEAPIARRASDSELRRENLRQGRSDLKSIITNPSLIANNYAFFAFGYLLFFAVNWLPGYLQHTYAVGLKETGVLLIAPWITATVFLGVAGCISDYLLIKTGSRRIARSHMIWICQLLSAVSFIPVIMVHSLPVAIVFLSLGLGIGLMPNSAFYALNSDLAGDRAATSLGVMTSCSAMASIAAPALTGFLSNATGNFNSAIALLIGFTLTSVAGILLFQHPDGPQSSSGQGKQSDIVRPAEGVAAPES